MHAFVSAILVFFALLETTSAKTVVVKVGGNTTENPGGVFQPATVTADVGDVVYFEFDQGNHTVTQSVFAAPCVRAHDFNQTINGFDSGFRNAGNAQAITNLQFPVHNNATVWFFDWNTCAQGGVGAINIDDSTLETYDGFVRNAIRLNGTGVEQGSSSSSVPSRTNTASTPASSSSNGVTLPIKLGSSQAAVPLVLSAFALLF